MSRVLVSGVSGFLGSHVTRALLDAGFNVRGTVRSTSKGAQMESIFASNSFSYVIVPDAAAEGAFNDAVVGVDYVLHTASPFHFHAADATRDLVNPAVEGTLSILNAVAKHGSSVKRVVITSSVAAIRNPTQVVPGSLSEADWNTYGMAEYQRLGSATPSGIAYPASKALAEKAAWDFMAKATRSFDLATINPPFIFGPTIHPCARVEDLNTSVKLIADFYLGNISRVNPTAAFGFVDVRDVARAHVLAMTFPAASGQRILVSSGPVTHQKIVQTLKAAFPSREYATGTSTAVPLTEINAKSKKILLMGEYIGFEKTIVDTVESLKSRFNLE
ncbi:methylglyoxal reductase (NADPH-dependent) gre2 [Entophlyctis luteolus]|nr:methylglyoxal reductase (NADPH-dependent) gre2 [Entophlyctis luteolus]KAJ3344450.1 methylglyoxal reductase (NADPH-dependent) gre2 [Entophlyctis luteolus]KAJ3381875.1 methylglyoxal reductase (NADPH-dependent) gre2 [Entophlyctis sp. JEL0112]